MNFCITIGLPENDGQESFLEPNGVAVVAAHRVNKKERPFIRTITEQPKKRGSK